MCMWVLLLLSCQAWFVNCKEWISEWGEKPNWRRLNEEAMAVANAGNPGRSVQLFQEAFAEHQSAELLNNIAVSLEQTGRFRESHEMYLRAVTLNANQGAYRTLRWVHSKGGLQVDVAAHVTAERRAQVQMAPSSGSCSAIRPPVPPETGASLSHLVNRSHPPPVWGGPTVIVVAHWNEDLSWLHRDGFVQVPRVLYQRRDATQPYYSPNFGFEAGVFLQFIVEHYNALPEQVTP